MSGDRREGFYVDPQSFGELRGDVNALKDSVERMGEDVKSLIETRSRGWGILAGITLAGGSVGAALHKLFEVIK